MLTCSISPKYYIMIHDLAQLFESPTFNLSAFTFVSNHQHHSTHLPSDIVETLMCHFAVVEVC